MAADRVSLQDVASAAGVALSTASNALNNRGRVAAATRLRVQETAEGLGYLPNPTARDLRVGDSRLIGMVLRMYIDVPDPYPADMYYRMLITTCATTASRRGYAMVLLPDTRIEIARGLPLAAIIVVDTEVHDPTLDQVHSFGVPVVTDFRPGDRRQALSIDVDVPHAVALTNDHLRAAGVQRPGLLNLYPRRTPFSKRWETFHKKWCADAGAPAIVARAPSSDHERLTEAAAELIRQGCDAIVGVPVGAAQGMLAAAANLGAHVPDDVLIVALDEDPELARADPPITTVAMDPQTTALTGTNLLIDLIEGKVQSPQEHFVQAYLKIRQSTTPRTPTPQVRTTRS
jgi:DNA-binding LacI/PurR family transcriptional regulator